MPRIQLTHILTHAKGKVLGSNPRSSTREIELPPSIRSPAFYRINIHQSVGKSGNPFALGAKDRRFESCHSDLIVP